MIEQSRPGDRKIENLDALCTEGAGELPIAANGVLPGNPALLVSDRAEGDVGRPVAKTVVCSNAVARANTSGRFVCMRRVTAIAPLVPSFAPAPNRSKRGDANRVSGQAAWNASKGGFLGKIS
jgi:hypothetical protein